jgi:hypothetical protein
MIYTFDVAYNCPISDFFLLLETHNLKLESFTSIGPAGGNPEVTVSGSEESIEQIKKNIFQII